MIVILNIGRCDSNFIVKFGKKIFLAVMFTLLTALVRAISPVGNLLFWWWKPTQWAVTKINLNGQKKNESFCIRHTEQYNQFGKSIKIFEIETLNVNFWTYHMGAGGGTGGYKAKVGFLISFQAIPILKTPIIKK